jgi:hypothetical protein
MEEHYTVCQHSTPFLLNCHTQFLVFRNTLLALLCPLLHEFHHQHSCPVPKNSCHKTAFWQADNISLNFSACIGESVLLWLRFGFKIHKWNAGFITCYSYDVTEKFISIFGVPL